MASIRRRSKEDGGGYQVRYQCTDGKSHARTFRRKVDAEKFARNVETDKDRGEWINPRLARITFEEWTTEWLSTIRHVKPGTRANYETILRAHLVPYFGDMEMGKIQPVHVRAFIAHLVDAGLAPSRVGSIKRLLANIFNAAVANGTIAKSPVDGVKVPHVEGREMHFLTAAEVTRLADHVEPPNDILIYILAYGGLRYGEAAALRRSRVNLLRSRLDVVESVTEVNGKCIFGPTKTYLRRSVVIPAFLRDMLARHLDENVPDDPDALVFTAPRGGVLSYHNFRRRDWIPARQAAGFPDDLRIHDLRHTCAALLISKGAPAKMIQAHLGHATISLTFDRYGHLYPDDQERIAEALDATFRNVHIRSG